MIEELLTTHILTPNEKTHYSLNTDTIQIIEENELYKNRKIRIIHPLTDNTHSDPHYYDSLLNHGNKIWRNTTCDGDSCLYIINGLKKYDFQKKTIEVNAMEALTEFSQLKTIRTYKADWTPNSNLLNTPISNPGNIVREDKKTHFNGAFTLTTIFNEIQKNTEKEFQYRYKLENGKIKRYIDYLTNIGRNHNQPIELGYNTDNITVEKDESEVAIAAAPSGSIDNSDKEFHKNREKFEKTAIYVGQKIPAYYTKNEKGKTIAGPTVRAPYLKRKNTNYVECTNNEEINSNYSYIYDKNGETRYPRLVTFDSNESHPISMYWECVGQIREHIQPHIEIQCKLHNLHNLRNLNGTFYNVGDYTGVKLPGRTDVIRCRVTKTVKNPRKPESDTIEISNQTSRLTTRLFNDYFKAGGLITL